MKQQHSISAFLLSVITAMNNLSVTKKHTNRRYSQIEVHSPKVCQLLYGLSVMIAQDQKEANVAHDEADLLTVREVAKQLRVDDTTVRRWIKNGALEAITLPHRGTRQAYRIRRSTVDALLTPVEPAEKSE
jgi:excisionase family DNA binding protein